MTVCVTVLIGEFRLEGDGHPSNGQPGQSELNTRLLRGCKINSSNMGEHFERG